MGSVASQRDMEGAVECGDQWPGAHARAREGNRGAEQRTEQRRRDTHAHGRLRGLIELREAAVGWNDGVVGPKTGGTMGTGVMYKGTDTKFDDRAGAGP